MERHRSLGSQVSLLNALEPDTCARLGTLGAQWVGVDESPGFTTPPASVLHPFMARMVADGVKRLVMEVSLSCDCARAGGCRRFPGRYTNDLARDHLDFHGDVDTYHRTKLDWLDSLSEQGLSCRARAP